jgi:nitrogen fixation/metabolism regulation signal transduction histidine kinase
VTIADAGWDGEALARVLTRLGRAFASGFELPTVLDTFLDAMAELVRPSRMALLLETSDGAFVVAAQRGLPRALVEAARLPGSRGLVRWLKAHGRPAPLPDAEDDVARQLELLHAIVAVPLLAHGDLVGLLALGEPIARNGYGARQLETLFDLATHIATAVRDIALHHELARTNEFTERILAHMSSGVVTIGPDHRIGMLNQRAAEILGLDARQSVGEDLRLLPSPLGDMLFEALSTGHATRRTELQLALGSRWLEVSTYAILGNEPEALGAVLVFDDITARKELAAQQQRVAQVELLARVVSRIADEIKNPLVSINTFVELLDERVDDGEFRKDFCTIVRRDARRVVEVLEKLAGLVGQGELNSGIVDVQTVVDDLVAGVRAGDEYGDRQPVIEVTHENGRPRVRADIGQLRRALSYLIGYLVLRSHEEPAKVNVTVGRVADDDRRDTVRVLVASRTASVTAETLEHLFDPVRMVQESLADVGPAVSQRIVEALGGRLRVRQTRADLSFLMTLPAVS